MKIKIYIAGHNGMVGRSIHKYIIKNKIGTLITTSRKALNLENFNKVNRFIKKNKPDVIINCAGRVGGILANNNFPTEFLNENIEIMKYCISYDINRFLVMPPAYYSGIKGYGDEGAYNFFSNIIQNVQKAEIILYNFERLCGYKFSAAIIEKLVKNFPQQILGVKDSSYNLYEILKIPNFLIFPGSETKLLAGLKLGCSGIISAVCNVTAPLARKVYDDFYSKKEQTLNKKLCDVRAVFDRYNLISALHSFMSLENENYNIVLPPLHLLSETKQKELKSSLKELDFFPEKNIAA